MVEFLVPRFVDADLTTYNCSFFCVTLPPLKGQLLGKCSTRLPFWITIHIDILSKTHPQLFLSTAILVLLSC